MYFNFPIIFRQRYRWNSWSLSGRLRQKLLGRGPEPNRDEMGRTTWWLSLLPYNHPQLQPVNSAPLSSFIITHTRDIITGGDSLAKWTTTDATRRRDQKRPKKYPTLHFIYSILIICSGRGLIFGIVIK